MPAIETVKLRAIDFFPAFPGEGSRDLKRICIGTKTRTIGDALLLSSVPAKLKALRPDLEITTYPRAFNPVVFYGNPHILGVEYFPGRLFGDDVNAGGGHSIQFKERGFGCEPAGVPKPELHLQPQEAAWGERTVQGLRDGDQRPLVFLHAWGHTWKKVAAPGLWSTLIREWRSKAKFIQIGVKGQVPIEGIEGAFFFEKNPWEARKLFALFPHADAFLGVNSGPMHVARAFGVPSLIFTEEGDPSELFRKRQAGPYYVHRNWAHAFLYEDLPHVDLPAEGMEGAIARAAAFFHSLGFTDLAPGA